MKVDGIEVLVEGEAADSMVLVHGWPDTLRLWDATVDALKPHWRCVRFTLPGFDLTQPARAYALDEVVDTLRQIVQRCCPGERVTLLVHDWGCLYGYQFAMRHPELVSRIIGVDIGDAGSRAHRRELGIRAKLMALAYQLWLAVAWKLGGALGDRMARAMAGAMRCPAPPQAIGAQMGYPYAVQWFGVKGGFRDLRPFDPQVPMLYLYGQRKPFMFHSQAWLDALARRPGCRVVGLRTGHWVMANEPQDFQAEVMRWLRETAPATGDAATGR
jgi:pimeloyl-ACP methyl ester carboxylesterase